jgi:hypothetical protein
MALVYTGTADVQRLFVLHGPAGSPPDGWAEDDGVPAVADVTALSAAVRDDAGLVHLVVVTLSRGISAAYSPAPQVSDEASVSREYRAFPLEDGVGTTVARGEPRRFALRLQVGTSTTISGFDVGASDLTPPSQRSTPLPVSVQRAPSCTHLAVADDTPALVDQALGQAGLAAAEVTGLRQLWCRRTGYVAALALTVTATHGPDVQCYEAAVRTDAGLGFDRQCWPVPRGRGASAPFVAPADPDEGTTSRPEFAVWAPGARRLEVRSPLRADRLVAGALVAGDGYGHVTVPVADLSSDSLELVLRDVRGREIARLPAQDVHGDAWGDAADGPVLGAQR